MTLEDFNIDSKMNNQSRKKLTKTLVAVLRRAQIEKRLTCALVPAIKMLETDPDGALFCILPQSRQGDSALHIHSILLQAFCYENNIKIIKVDSADKLGGIVVGGGMSTKSTRKDCSCVLVHSNPSVSEDEQELARFCLETSDTFPPPIIQLPES